MQGKIISRKNDAHRSGTQLRPYSWRVVKLGFNDRSDDLRSLGHILTPDCPEGCLESPPSGHCTGSLSPGFQSEDLIAPHCSSFAEVQAPAYAKWSLASHKPQHTDSCCFTVKAKQEQSPGPRLEL